MDWRRYLYEGQGYGYGKADPPILLTSCESRDVGLPARETRTCCKELNFILAAQETITSRARSIPHCCDLMICYADSIVVVVTAFDIDGHHVGVTHYSSVVNAAFSLRA